MESKKLSQRHGLHIAFTQTFDRRIDKNQTWYIQNKCKDATLTFLHTGPLKLKAHFVTVQAVIGAKMSWIIYLHDLRVFQINMRKRSNTQYIIELCLYNRKWIIYNKSLVSYVGIDQRQNKILICQFSDDIVPRVSFRFYVQELFAQLRVICCLETDYQQLCSLCTIDGWYTDNPCPLLFFDWLLFFSPLLTVFADTASVSATTCANDM